MVTIEGLSLRGQRNTRVTQQTLLGERARIPIERAIGRSKQGFSYGEASRHRRNEHRDVGIGDELRDALNDHFFCSVSGALAAAAVASAAALSARLGAIRRRMSRWLQRRLPQVGGFSASPVEKKRPRRRGEVESTLTIEFFWGGRRHDQNPVRYINASEKWTNKPAL